MYPPLAVAFCFELPTAKNVRLTVDYGTISTQFPQKLNVLDLFRSGWIDFTILNLDTIASPHHCQRYNLPTASMSWSKSLKVSRSFCFVSLHLDRFMLSRRMYVLYDCPRDLGLGRWRLSARVWLRISSDLGSRFYWCFAHRCSRVLRGKPWKPACSCTADLLVVIGILPEEGCFNLFGVVRGRGELPMTLQPVHSALSRNRESQHASRCYGLLIGMLVCVEGSFHIDESWTLWGSSFDDAAAREPPAIPYVPRSDCFHFGIAIVLLSFFETHPFSSLSSSLGVLLVDCCGRHHFRHHGHASTSSPLYRLSMTRSFPIGRPCHPPIVFLF